MSVASKLADFVLDTTWEQIPESVKRSSRTAFTDSVGCMISGSHTEGAQGILNYLKEWDGSSEAAVLCSGRRSSLPGAALAEGMFAHSQDFDNSSCFLGHGSSVIVPVLLTLVQKYPKSGKEVLRAYMLAMESGFQLSKAMVPEISFRGFHGTSVFGCITASIAASLMAGLDRQQLVNAISLAATSAGGLMVNFGTMTKFYHVGMAAARGIQCMQLAQSGIQASPLAFEGPNGFAQGYAGKSLREEDLPLGNPWCMDTAGVLIKLFPCCSAAHSALCGVRRIMNEEGIGPRDVENITVLVPEYTVHCLKYHDPQDEGECRFSMEYALASMLHTGRYNLRSFERRQIEDPQIRQTMKRIQMQADSRFPEFLDEEPAVVTIRLKDGRSFTRSMEYPDGRTVESPCTEEMIFEKFADCASGLPEKTVQQIFDFCYHLDDQKEMDPLIEMLR